MQRQRPEGPAEQRGERGQARPEQRDDHHDGAERGDCGRARAVALHGVEHVGEDERGAADQHVGAEPEPPHRGGEPPQIARVPGVDAEAGVGEDDPPARAVPFDVRPGELERDVGVTEGAQVVGGTRLLERLPVGVAEDVGVAQLAVDQPPELVQDLQLLRLIGGEAVVERGHPAEEPLALRLPLVRGPQLAHERARPRRGD